MSQETTCDLTSSTSSIPLVTEPVSPCQVINADVHPRWRKRIQRKRLGVEPWGASGGISQRLAVTSSDIRRDIVVAAIRLSSNADQDESETLYVSPAAGASSLGEGTSTSLLSLREVGSSSGEPVSTGPTSNEEEATSSIFETTVPLTSPSNASDPTVSTPDSVTATISSTSIVLSTTSSSSRASPTIPLDTPTSTSAVQSTITSAPPAIPSESSDPSPPPSATSSTSSRLPESSSLSTRSASAMVTSDPFPGNFPSSTRSSSIARSASQTLRTTFILPDPTPSSEPSDSSSRPSWSDDSDTSYLPTSSTPSQSSDIPDSSPTTSSQSDDIFGQSSFTSFSPSEPLTTPTRTFTITKVFITTFSDGSTTTVSKVVETGVLRTDTPVHSNLSRTTGAIAGITVSVVAAVLLLIVLLFFGCRRYRSRRDARMGSIDTILARAREVWRPPLDGDDDDGSYMHGYGATNPLTRRQTMGSQSQSGEDGYTGTKDPGSSGDHSSGDGGHGSAESGNMRGVNTMSPSFGGQPSMSGFGQNLEGTFPRPEAVVFPVHSSEDVKPEDADQYWWGINDPQLVAEEGGDATHPGTGAGGRSAASLTVFGGSSSGGHGSAMEPSVKPNVAKRASLSGPRPMPPDRRRNRSSPPTSFAPTSPVRNSTFDCERQNPEQQAEKNTMIGLLNRLRLTSTHRLSGQSVATLKGSQESVVVPPFPPNLYSPSLLNPPTPIPPQTQDGIPFPRSVTSNGYPDPPLPSVSPEMSNYTSRPASVPWPPITLPPPSPVLTDNSSLLAEGLLHPRLSSLPAAGQASTASLRDHEDYTRPLVNNHLCRTTTFDTLDSDDGVVMAS